MLSSFLTPSPKINATFVFFCDFLKNLFHHLFPWLPIKNFGPFFSGWGRYFRRTRDNQWWTRDNQRCFRILTFFFIADSENIKNNSDDQLCFRADQLSFSLNQRFPELKILALFHIESSLNQRCSALNIFALKHGVFRAEQRWYTLN